MKTLITGAAGFLGASVVERLLARGYREVRCLVRTPEKAARLNEIAARYGVTLDYSYGNLNSLADCRRAVEGREVVFHLAAAKTGSAADMFLNSVVGSRNLLDAIGERRPMRLVLISSFGVYGVAGLKRGALVNEDTPLEPHPERRDVYSFVKLRQERLFHEYQRRNGFELIVLRPGVIYGPGGGAFSTRVGLDLFGCFLFLGGSNILPLSYVDNCAEAIVVAGMAPGVSNAVLNVHDDELPTARQYLRAFERNVKKMRFIRVPYFALMWISRMAEAYNRRSKGQLPAIFTPYKTASLWGGNRFDNSRLKSAGWKQIVPTQEGLRRAFEALRG